MEIDQEEKTERKKMMMMMMMMMSYSHLRYLQREHQGVNSEE